MSIQEKAGELAGRVRSVLQDPIVREVTGHLKAATETQDSAVEQEHLGAIKQILDEHLPPVQPDTQSEEPRP